MICLDAPSAFNFNKQEVMTMKFYPGTTRDQIITGMWGHWRDPYRQYEPQEVVDELHEHGFDDETVDTMLDRYVELQLAEFSLIPLIAGEMK